MRLRVGRQEGVQSWLWWRQQAWPGEVRSRLGASPSLDFRVRLRWGPRISDSWLLHFSTTSQNNNCFRLPRNKVQGSGGEGWGRWRTPWWTRCTFRRRHLWPWNLLIFSTRPNTAHCVTSHLLKEQPQGAAAWWPITIQILHNKLVQNFFKTYCILCPGWYVVEAMSERPSG